MRVIAGFIMAGCLLPVAAQVLPPSQRSCPSVGTITITAHGSATGEADLAIVHVACQAYGSDKQAACAAGAAKSSAVMRALADASVAVDANESTNQAMTPTQMFQLQQYPIDSEERINHKYTVVQGCTARVKPAQVRKVLDAAIQAGAMTAAGLTGR
jgi:uncharacterized protein YggE